MKTRITGVALFALLVTAPMLMAAGCPWGGDAHHGSWVAEQDHQVTLFQFGSDGQMRRAEEVYSAHPVLDEMKIETTAKCERSKEPSPFDDGSYILECTDTRTVRTSRGLGAAYSLAVFAGRFIADSVPDEEWAKLGQRKIRLKKEGDTLIYFSPVYEKRKVIPFEQKKFRPVPMKSVNDERAAAWLERFREGTVEVDSVDDARRERDLP